MAFSLVSLSGAVGRRDDNRTIKTGEHYREDKQVSVLAVLGSVLGVLSSGVLGALLMFLLTTRRDKQNEAEPWTRDTGLGCPSETALNIVRAC